MKVMKKSKIFWILIALVVLVLPLRVVHAEKCNNDRTQAFNEAYNLLSNARTGEGTQISMNSHFLAEIKKMRKTYCDPLILDNETISLEEVIKQAAKELINSIKQN